MSRKINFCFWIALSIWWVGITPANAYSEHLLHKDNLEELSRMIHIQYSTLPQNVIYQYLEAQLHYLPASSEIPCPKIEGIYSLGDRNIIFEWKEEPEADGYHVSYLNLYSGDLGNFNVYQPKISLQMNEGYNFHLYTFASVKDNDGQSILSIFIVDRDAFLYPPDDDDNVQPPGTPDGRSPSLTSFPNPFFDQTSIRFELPEETKVSFYLSAPDHNIAIPNFIQPQTLSKGRHEQIIDLSAFPPGQYFCTLQSAQETQVIPLIHLSD